MVHLQSNKIELKWNFNNPFCFKVPLRKAHKGHLHSNLVEGVFYLDLPLLKTSLVVPIRCDKMLSHFSQCLYLDKPTGKMFLFLFPNKRQFNPEKGMKGALEANSNQP